MMMMHSIKARVFATALGLSVSYPQLSAQTLFEFPDSRIDVTNFRYVENCMAAARRVQDSLKAVGSVQVDTIAVTAMNSFETDIAQEVLDVTKRCLTKFTPEQIPAPFAQIAQQAFLAAGRDADAAKIVKLQIDAIADSTSRAFLMDSFARNYIDATPRRVTAAHAIVDEVLRYGDRYPSLHRAGMCLGMIRAAIKMQDKETIKKYGPIARAAVKNATPEELSIPMGDIYIPIMVRELNQHVFKEELLDSLRVSTKAFLALQTAKYNEVMTFHRDGSPVGRVVSPLVGDYWFPASAAQEQYPRKGHVSIINFPSTDLELYNMRVHVVVRRLKERYPGADLVFSGATQGFFGPGAEQDTKADATKQSTLFQGFRGNTNAVLGIAKSEIVELPPPDKRRIHIAPINYQNYPQSGDERFVFIVDDDGILVEHQFVANMFYEIWLDDVVRVLIERQKRNRQ